MNTICHEKKNKKPNQQSQKKEQSSLLTDLQKFFEDGNNKTGNLFDRIFTKLSETDLLISGPDSEILLLVVTTCCNRKKQLPTKIWSKLEREIINNINYTKNPKFFQSRKRVKSLRQKFSNSSQILNCIANFGDKLPV